MTLDDLYQLAVIWCPKKARWKHLLENVEDWGCAHELAHALIEPSFRWKMHSYGRCSIGFCEHHLDQCDTYEAAAMYISRTLLVAVGQPQLAEREVQNTNDYDLIDLVHFTRAKALLKRKGLWPVPRTKRSLEAALKRRLRIPRGGRPRKSRDPTMMLLAMLASRL